MHWYICELFVPVILQLLYVSVDFSCLKSENWEMLVSWRKCRFRNKYSFWTKACILQTNLQFSQFWYYSLVKTRSQCPAILVVQKFFLTVKIFWDKDKHSFYSARVHPALTVWQFFLPELLPAIGLIVWLVCFFLTCLFVCHIQILQASNSLTPGSATRQRIFSCNLPCAYFRLTSSDIFISSNVI